jgi:Uma2 family endonuclease
LNLILAAYAREHPDRCVLFVPKAAVWTPADTYLEPDLFLVATERVEATGAGSLATADLVVEILSPSTAHYDRTTKADTYAALGVRELWLVDLERRTIEQRVLVDGGWRVDGVHGGDAIVRAASFPELTVRAADVFA